MWYVTQDWFVYRFSEGGGVTQPSQKRYVKYFEKILKQERKYGTVLKHVDSISFHTSPAFNFDQSCRPSVTVVNVHDDTVIFSNKKNKALPRIGQDSLDKNGDATLITPGQIPPVIGDVLMKFHNSGAIFSNFMFRFAFSTALSEEE